ncbi:MAG: hypothetical protein LBU17_03760 [Treponema sp.]|jgi:hypothetical protein|nr:hypothetical protein [Treponema sp.]
MFAFFEDIRKMDVPVIAVIEDTDERPIGSFWGEVQASTCKSLGAIGTLTHGGVRDITEVGPLGFYFFSTDIMVARAESYLTRRSCSYLNLAAKRFKMGRSRRWNRYAGGEARWRSAVRICESSRTRSALVKKEQT